MTTNHPNLEKIQTLAVTIEETHPDSNVCLRRPRPQAPGPYASLQPFLEVSGFGQSDYETTDTRVMAYTLDDVTDVAGIPDCDTGTIDLEEAWFRAEAGAVVYSVFAIATREAEEHRQFDIEYSQRGN